MKIGIKYCGGCNPRYQRSEEVVKFKNQMLAQNDTAVTIEFVDDAQTLADIWLVVCGCPTACAKTEHLQARWETFFISHPRDFVKIKKEIKRIQEEHVKQQKDTNRKRRCIVGQKASMTKQFLEKDVQAFAALTGDYSGMHTDPVFARQCLYRKPVVHGVLVGSLLSSVMGMELPGPGTIFLGEELEFCQPVFWNDTITAEVTFVSYEETQRYYIGTFSGVCKNQQDIVVATGNSRQMMLKKLFEVGEV